MPAKSKAQFRAMAAAASGDSKLDIPPEYLRRVRYSKLPERKGGTEV